MVIKMLFNDTIQHNKPHVHKHWGLTPWNIPKDHPSQIVYRPDKPVGGGFLMDVTNAKEELGYEPKYDVEALFRNYKEEMEVNRFKELRGE